MYGNERAEITKTNKQKELSPFRVFGFGLTDASDLIFITIELMIMLEYLGDNFHNSLLGLYYNYN